MDPSFYSVFTDALNPIWGQLWTIYAILTPVWWITAITLKIAALKRV